MISILNSQQRSIQKNDWSLWFECNDQIGAKDDGTVYQHDYSVELCYGGCIIMKRRGGEKKS